MFLRKLRNNNRNRKGLAFVLAFIVMISMLTMGAIFDIETTKVTFTQKDVFEGAEKTENIVTTAKTVEEFLNEQKIVLGEDDVLNAELSAEIYPDQEITVEKSRLVGICVDGKTSFERTMKRTVGKVLEEKDIVLGENDIVEPEENTVVKSDMTITVKRVNISEEVVETEIQYESKKEEDSSLYIGETKIKQYGVKGIKKEVYEVKKSEGEEDLKTLISSEITKEPVDEIILVGTKKKVEEKKEKPVKQNKEAVAENTSNETRKVVAENNDVEVKAESAVQTNEVAPAVSDSGKGFAYKKVMTMNATAYDPTLNGTIPASQITAYGLVCQYGVVAVDPNVIPLGTKLYIESSDGGASWVYGYCIAGDTGGAIKGNKIDLCFSTPEECRRFGRKTATVYILE